MPLCRWDSTFFLPGCRYVQSCPRRTSMPSLERDRSGFCSVPTLISFLFAMMNAKRRKKNRKEQKKGMHLQKMFVLGVFLQKKNARRLNLLGEKNCTLKPVRFIFHQRWPGTMRFKLFDGADPQCSRTFLLESLVGALLDRPRKHFNRFSDAFLFISLWHWTVTNDLQKRRENEISVRRLTRLHRHFFNFQTPS